jgi:hypothetical protein
VRQHERRVHPDLYKQDLEARLPEAESSLLTKIAQGEVSNTNGKFYNEMVAATGLTKHQIRHRRDKLECKRYLENARKELAASFLSDMANVPNNKIRKTTAATQSTSARKIFREDNNERSRCTGAVPRVRRARAAVASDARLEKGSDPLPGPTTRARVVSLRRSPASSKEMKNNSLPGGPAIGLPFANEWSSLIVEAEIDHRPEGKGAASP